MSLKQATLPELNEKLELAVKMGNELGVQEILALGADIHDHNDSALRYAAFSGRNDLVEILLAHGATIDALEGEALRGAVKNNRIATARLLLKRGANPSLKTYEALCFAAELDSKSMIDLLLTALFSSSHHKDMSAAHYQAYHTDITNVLKNHKSGMGKAISQETLDYIETQIEIRLATPSISPNTSKNTNIQTHTSIKSPHKNWFTNLLDFLKNK